MRGLQWIAIFGAVAALWPDAAEAQGYYRGRGGWGGTVMSPFGPLYNTNSPEYRMSGGNPLVMQQLMEQKAMMLQQQQYLRMQQQYLKQQQQQKNKGKSQDDGGQLRAAGGSNSLGPSPFGTTATRRHRKRHRTTTSAAGKSQAPAADKAANASTSTGPAATAAQP